MQTQTTTRDETCNGWTNYETWAINLWITDSKADDETAREIVRTAFDNARAATERDPHAIVAPLSNAADALRDLVEEWRYDVVDPVRDRAGKAYTNPLISGMFADLVTAALGRVNWHEIAEHYAEGLKEEQEQQRPRLVIFECTGCGHNWAAEEPAKLCPFCAAAKTVQPYAEQE